LRCCDRIGNRLPIRKGASGKRHDIQNLAIVRLGDFGHRVTGEVTKRGWQQQQRERKRHRTQDKGNDCPPYPGNRLLRLDYASTLHGAYTFPFGRLFIAAVPRMQISNLYPADAMRLASNGNRKKSLWRHRKLLCFQAYEDTGRSLSLATVQRDITIFLSSQNRFKFQGGFPTPKSPHRTCNAFRFQIERSWKTIAAKKSNIYFRQRHLDRFSSRKMRKLHLSVRIPESLIGLDCC
jgi:hypothetical protein